MTLRRFTLDEQIEAVEAVLADLRRGMVPSDSTTAALKSVASDLRARRPRAPTEALLYLQRRIDAVARSKTDLGYGSGPLIGLAQEVVGRWPVLRLALEEWSNP